MSELETEYTKLATEVKQVIDKMYAALKKGKNFRLAADEVHNLMLRISAFGEEAEDRVESKVREIFIEKEVVIKKDVEKLVGAVEKDLAKLGIINKKIGVVSGDNSTEQKIQGTKPTEGSPVTDTKGVPTTK